MQGGAALATYRLHTGLRRIGVDSTLLVQGKVTDDCNVLGPQTKFQNTLAKVTPYLDQLAVRLYRNREQQLFSSGITLHSLLPRVQKINPDIIHLSWVAAGFLPLGAIKKFKKPIVWTLHDMWPFTGGCHYDGECGKYRQSCGACPVLHSSNEYDLSKWNWKRKERAWKDLDLTVVAPSSWLAECARSSSLFGHCRIEVLPNAIDEARYKPIDKTEARYAYNLPQDKKLILFSASGDVNDKRKGFQFLLPALRTMAHNGWDGQSELVIIGAAKPKEPIHFGMKAHYIGRLYDDMSQVLLYSAADVVVAPSVQENLSNTVMESLACGTPVVAFNIGGMPDLIQHTSNGYLVEPYSPEGLAGRIVWVLENESRRDLLSQHAREDAAMRYGLTHVAAQYQALYQDILG